MKKFVIGTLALFFSVTANADVGTTEDFLANCRISDDPNRHQEDIIFKRAEIFYSNNRRIVNYVLDYSYSELGNQTEQIFGAYENVRHRFFTTNAANADGFIGVGAGSQYIMESIFDFNNDEIVDSQVDIILTYTQPGPGSTSIFSLQIAGFGAAFDFAAENFQEKLDESDFYGPGGIREGEALECLVAVNLDQFLTE